MWQQEDSGAAAPTPDLVHFGEALVRLRRAHGLTQSDLATRLQVAASTISRLERGRLAPPVNLSRQLPEVFSLAPPAASWLQALAAHARLTHATQAEIDEWDGAHRLLAWLALQRSQISRRKEDSPTDRN